MSDCCGKKEWAEPCDPCPDLTQIQPAAGNPATVTFTFDSEDGVGTVVFNDGAYGPGFTVRAPDGTEYTGFIDLFHFKQGEENCLQIVVDPVQGDHDTFHARFYPDGRVVTYVE
jgi:hypothetical protein